VTIGLLAIRRNRAAGSLRPDAAGVVAESVASDVVIGGAADAEEGREEIRA
jgi:hypothetical protein